MNNKPTREELEHQVTELRQQNNILRLLSSSRLSEQSAAIDFFVAVSESESNPYAPTILNNMGDSVFVKDEQSRLLFVNDAFCEMFNLPRTEIIGETLAENVPENERESFLKIDKEVLFNGIENINEETLTVREGEPLIISTRKSRFVDSNGKKFLVGVIRDITQRKKSEQLLRESETRYRELNTTKDKLFSIIAHDLRSPFNNIVSLAGLLHVAVNVPDIESSQQYVGMIHSTAQHTLVLLDNLLNWAKSQTGQIEYKSEKIDLSTIIQEIVDLSQASAQTKNISLTHITSGEINIWSDEKMLKTILRNLISNAIKFTRSGGEISVSVCLDKNHVQITVSDNGVGMNDETRKKLFGISSNISTPGTANEKGSGFGLVLCKEFIDKLGGTISVKSTEGKGSDFTFMLPA